VTVNEKTYTDRKKAGKKAVGFGVKCRDYLRLAGKHPFKTREAAEAILQRIEEVGACLHHHEVVEVYES
jgi:hypothetical protein